MSTSCVFPRPTDEAFRLARTTGFDGVEVMVTADRGSRDAGLLRASVGRWGLPVLSVHAPVLPAAHFALGRDQRDKLRRSAELAAELGAATLVVHPPFRWQRRIAASFVDVVREVAEATGVELAVENMFPWRVGPLVADVYSPGHDPVPLDVAAATLDFSHAAVAGRDSLDLVRQLAATTGVELAVENMFPWRAGPFVADVYSPGHDPSDLDVEAAVLDFSHAAVAGRDALDLALALGPRLRHVHLCDGVVSPRPGGLVDQHLVPGTGDQPVAEVLGHLARSGWSGSVVAEVHARGRATDEGALTDVLRRTLGHARAALAAGAASVGAAPAGVASTLAASVGRGSATYGPTSTVATTASGTATTATPSPPSTTPRHLTSTPIDVSRPCQSSVASEAQGATRQPTLTPTSTATSRSGEPATGSRAR